MTKYLIAFTLLLLALSLKAEDAAGCNLAELTDCDVESSTKSGWQFGVGIATVSTIPDYIGSDESRSLILPIPYVRYDSEKFKIGQSGIVGKLFKSEKWFLSLSLSGAIPVDSDDNQARQGMSDLEAVFEYGPSLKYYFQGNEKAVNAVYLDLNFREARTISFDSLGINASPAIVMQRQLQQNVFGGQLNWVLRYRREFVSDTYADYFYGVEQQFATENRPEYKASGGNAGYRINSNIRWQKGDNVFALFAVYADISNAEYHDSPLVKTKQHFYGGLSYFWLF